MSRWIRWSQWEAAGMINFGQMPMEAIDKNLQAFENAAKEVLEKTGADHVLYGVKRYNEDGDLEEVRFYLLAMTDEEFEKDVASKSGITVYALRRR